ncbi:MAG TPA: zinc ribbon domain-containing protein [Candidatus Binataceae bacterium]|nr:zinc ribbon domain-containing protein [Candidatus Binataceae bacterium]
MPDPQFDQPRFCSRCGQPIVVAGAEFCKDCGAPIAPTRIFVPDPGFKPIVAFVLSVIPGLGHVYKGRVMRGVIWFVVVSIAYTMGPIGLLMHVICAMNAALSGALRDDGFSSPRIGRRTRAMRRAADAQDSWR